MPELLETAFSFPPVLFTGLLGLVLLYWLMVMLGALDIDAFDLDFDLDGDLDFDVDGGDLGDGAEGSPGGLAGVVSSLGLAGVPLTVSLSLLVLFSWVLVMIATGWARETFPDGGAALPLAGGALAALAASLGLTSLAVRPLKPVFKTHGAAGVKSFVGRTCTVTTLSVTDSHGQAEIDDGGAGLLVQVRCPRANTLTRGSEALVFDYDDADEVFLIAPLEEALSRSLRGDRLAAPAAAPTEAAPSSLSQPSSTAPPSLGGRSTSSEE